MQHPNACIRDGSHTVRALLSLQCAVLFTASAASFAAQPANGPHAPYGDHWVQIDTINDEEDNPPAMRGAVVYIDSDDMSYVGDGSKDDGYPININLWIILKNPADGPKGKYTEMNEQTFMMCDTKKFFNHTVLKYYDASGNNLGTDFLDPSDPSKEYTPINLGSVGNSIYDYACVKGHGR